MGFKLIPDTDHRQVVRMRRFLMAAASYGIWLALGLIGYFSGVLNTSTDAVIAIVSGILFTNMSLYLVFRTGLNLRYNDPSLTFFQIAVGLSWVLALMFTTREARGIMMMVYVMVLLFGIFRLDKLGFIKLSVFALSGYITVVIADYFVAPDRIDIAREFLQFGVLAGMVIWCAVFGTYVGNLKSALREKNTQLKKVVEEVTRLAERDDLTKSYNRRYIMETLQREKARADRSFTPFSICIFDLDHFKNINDQFGHIAGDRVLTAFAERARGELRSMDQFAFGRYGGEEFIVILPNTSAVGAHQCAERVRKITASNAFDDVYRITLSAGVAQYRIGESIEEVLRRADKALYRAKQDGRNVVCCEENNNGPGTGNEFTGVLQSGAYPKPF